MKTYNPLSPSVGARDRPADPLPYSRLRDVEASLDGNWLIDGLLPKQGSSVVSGHPGSGKSFLAAKMAAHVAQGTPFAGRAVEGGPVVYLAAEGARGFRNRLVGLMDTGTLSRAAPLFLIETQVDLQATDRKEAARLAETVREIVSEAGANPVLIVIDTLSKTFGGGKENTDDMVSYVRNLDWLAEQFRCLVMALHHRPKDSDNRTLRGHGSLLGGVEMAAMLDAGPIKTLTIEKQKDGESGIQLRFKLEQHVLGQDKRGKDVTTCVVRLIDDSGDVADDRKSITRRKLVGQARQALDAIEILIAKHGVAPPADVPADLINRYRASNAIPAGQVSDRLRKQFLATEGGDPDKKEDSARRAGDRAVSKLKDLGLLGSWGEWLWID